MCIYVGEVGEQIRTERINPTTLKHQVSAHHRTMDKGRSNKLACGAGEMGRGLCEVRVSEEEQYPKGGLLLKNFQARFVDRIGRDHTS